MEGGAHKTIDVEKLERGRERARKQKSKEVCEQATELAASQRHTARAPVVGQHTTPVSGGLPKSS